MRELVLTGHEDLWPIKEEQSLFFGPHCFCYNNKYEFIEQNKFQIAPSPWKNAQDILEASLYIDELYDRIIPKLADIMNSLYGLSYSEKFWNVYMILWLQHWLGIIYDRYRRLEYIGERLEERFVVKILDEYNPVVSDFWSFISKITKSHYHNLLILSDIINYAQFDFLECKKISVTPDKVIKDKRLSFKSSLNNLLLSSKEIFKERLNCFFTSSVFLGKINGLSLADKIFIQFSRDPIFLFKKKLNPPAKAITIKRSELNSVRIEFGAKNRFEKVVQEILLKHMPDSLLTVYKYRVHTHPNIKTWVGMDMWTSQRKCFDIAYILERYGRLISSQHGGVYGQSLSFPLGKMEYQMTGDFITWGWEHKHIYNSNYHALPSPMLCKLKKHVQKDGSIIFVGTAIISYLYRLNNYLVPEQIVDYLENKLVFLKHLEKKLLQEIKYQPYPKIYGVKETELLGKVLSKNQILTGEKSTDLFLRAKLAVIDHPFTSLLEAMAVNIPTILYWDPAHFASCTAAAPYFDRLRSVGILYDKPEAAAKKVNEICPDVSGWWNDPDIQRAKNDFCFQFARAQTNWRSQWVQFVKNL